MEQLVVMLLGTLAVTSVIGFAFGGRVSLPTSIRRRRRDDDGPAPEPPPAAARPRAEAAAPGEPVPWGPAPVDDTEGEDDAERGEQVRGRRWRLRDAAGRAVGRIELLDVRDAVVGPHAVRIDDYRVTVRTRSDFSRLLDRDAVTAALDALVGAPADERARAGAVDALTAPGRWAAGAEEHQETLLLSVLGSERNLLLDGVLILRSQGVVLAGPDRRRSRYQYALGRTPAAAALLAGDEPLARALVDRFCPRGPMPLGPLDDLILAAIRPAAA